MSKRASLILFSGILLCASFAHGQSVTLGQYPQFVSALANGSPNAFGCVWTYSNGTTSPLGTFTDNTGATANPNPVPLNGGGAANIWYQSGQLYTVVVKTAGGVNCAAGSTILTVNGVNGSLLTQSNTWQQPQIFDDPITILAPDLQIVFGASSGNQTTLDIPPTTANYILHGPPLTANDTLLSQNATQTVTNKNLTTGTQINGCGVGSDGGSTTICVANNAVTATVLNSLAVLTGAPSTASVAPVGSPSTVGVVIQGAGITGTATIQQSGQVACTFDSGTTAGDAVITSAITAGNCHDAGTTSSAQSIGVVLSTNSTGGLYNFLLVLSSSGSSGNSGVVDTIANAGTTGTTLNTLTSLTGAPSTAVITSAASVVSGFIGITIGGAGTAGSAVIQKLGIANCVFDAATTAGHYVTASASIAGDCHDAGASRPLAGQLAGRVLTTNASGGSYPIDLMPSEIIPPPAAINLSYTATLGSPISIATSTPTTILNPVFTMPASGCPCRATVAWGIDWESDNAGVATAWVNDGTTSFASAWVGLPGSVNSGMGFNATGQSGTYTNGQVVTITLTLEQSTSGAFNVESTPQFGSGQATWINVWIQSSN
jgi:hypothetical protein